jgi:hypothetical protein
VFALADRWSTSPPTATDFLLNCSFVSAIANEFRARTLTCADRNPPPLLYSAAYNTSFINFKPKKGKIASLLVGLVIFPLLIIGLFAW